MSFTSTELRKDHSDYVPDIWMPGDPNDVIAFSNVAPPLLRSLKKQNGELIIIKHSDEILEHIKRPNLRLIAGRSGLKMSADVIEPSDSLAMIARCCIGTDGLDFAMAGEKGVVIVNSRQAANSVAEMAVEFALEVSRNTVGSIIEACIEIPEGKLRKSAENRRELRSMTVGIIGAGQIGQLSAEKLGHLTKEIIMYDDAPNAEAKIGSRGIKANSLDELLERSDIVIIHADADDHEGNSNEDLITAERLRGKDVFAVINLARGRIGKVAELVEAIEKGDIQRARTDVDLPSREAMPQWETSIPHEMVVSGKFVQTAHIGASTEEVQEAIGHDIIAKWEAFRQFRDVSAGLNFRSKKFMRPEESFVNSIIFQHSTNPGAIGILGQVLSNGGLTADDWAAKDMFGLPSKGRKTKLPWGLTRADLHTEVNETMIGAILESLRKKNGGFKLHRIAVSKHSA